jgi:cyanate lyase
MRMATINNRAVVDRLIADKGLDPNVPGDPRVVRIVEYTNREGTTCYGLVFEYETDGDMLYRYERPTQDVRNPKLFWKYR